MPGFIDPPTGDTASNLYFYFNETTDDLVYSDQATYAGEGYTSLGEQTNTNPEDQYDWIFNSKRNDIKTVTKDPNISKPIDVITNMKDMFLACRNIISLDLSGFDTSKVTSMKTMFSNCFNLISLDLSNFDTSNVTDMSSMFFYCSSLISIDLSNFDTSKVTDMSGMFKNCAALTSLELNGFDTSNVTDIDGMFYNCAALTSLDLSNFDTSKTSSSGTVFYSCSALRVIDISPNMSNVLSKLPANTYYDAVTRQPYAASNIPGGSTYVRDLADLDLMATMVQARMGINKVKRTLNDSNKKISGLSASIDTMSNQTSLSRKTIDVLSVDFDGNSQSVGSSLLFHETVKLSKNGTSSTFIRILGNINFSVANSPYTRWLGARIVLDVNKPDDDMTDLRCSGVVSAWSSEGECVFTGTYSGSLSTNTLYCAMVSIDQNPAASGITSLLFQ